MATFENTVLIARPVEDVFGFLSDLENIPKWNYAIVETRKISEGPVGVGTTYRQVRSVPSRSEEHLEITADSPPRQLAIRGQLGPFASRLVYALDAIPEGTRVTNTVELELGGPGRLLGRVAVPRLRRNSRQNASVSAAHIKADDLALTAGIHPVGITRARCSTRPPARTFSTLASNHRYG